MLKELLGELFTDDIAKKLEGKEFIEKSELNGNYIPKDRFDEVNNAKKDLAKEVKQYQDDIKKLSEGNVDLEAIKQQLTDKTEEFNKYQQGIELKEVNAKKTNALTAKLQELNALNPKLLVKEFNLEDVSFDDNGGLVGVKETFERLQADYAPQFGEAQTQTPNVHNNNGGGVTKEQFSQYTYKERMTLYNDNPKAYEELTK